jgi:hypothetical protein
MYIHSKPPDFLNTIINHYIRESQQGFGAAIFGGLLLIAAILLFRFANPLSFLRGFTIPFLLIGLLMGLGGSIDGYMARRAIPESTALFKKDRKAFFDHETTKVQKTHRSWRSIIRFWSLISVTGIALFFSAGKSYWTGVAIGTILVSMAGHIEEAISRKFNEKYYHQVMDASKNIAP